MSFLRRPQQTLVRRILFQVHLWTGLVVGAYALFIGVTGAALMFRADLQRWTYPAFFAARPDTTALAPPEAVITAIEQRFSGYRFSGFNYPTARRGTFLAYLAQGDELHTVFLDAARGTVIGELPHDGWIQRLQDLHFTFLLGRTGYLYNGIGASGLFLMCVTGLIV